MELEHFLEQRQLVHVRAVDIHPQLAFTRLEDFANACGGDVLLEHTVRPPVEAGRPVLRGLGLLRRDAGGGHTLKIARARAPRHRPRADRVDTLGLAPRFVTLIFDKLVALRRAGYTLMLVEQNAARALAIADRAYVLELGRNRFEGAGTALLADPEVKRLYLGG